MDCQSFYEERDSRTTEYVSGLEWAATPVGIAMDGRLASTRSGQVALLALVNMAARVHRTVAVSLPYDVDLCARSLVPADSLAEAISSTARAIDPCGQILIVDGAMLPEATISLGGSTNVPGAVHIGADGLLASVGDEPQHFDYSDETLLGAALASCLGAAALFGLTIGQRPLPARLSLHDFLDGHRARRGPGGVPELRDPGRALLVGAGAVASGLGYWVSEIGTKGDWVVVDGDILKLLNTNRSIGTTAAEAGWPGNDARPKVEGLARMLGGRPVAAWYDEWNGTETWIPDLVLPLANDRGVRGAMSSRGEERLVHAATSRNFTAELHRHIADLDDCIACRLPADHPEAPFACSTGSIAVPTREPTDAALPFLSAAAGLLLAYALTESGQSAVGAMTVNHIQLYLAPGEEFRFKSLRWPLRSGCSHVLPAATRARIAQRRRG